LKRSKLDIYIDILIVLARDKPLKITQIAQKANLNANKLKENLEFLTTSGMTEKRIQIEKHTAYGFYVITQKGFNTHIRAGKTGRLLLRAPLEK
jgi:predicted transcriptional regulator